MRRDSVSDSSKRGCINLPAPVRGPVDFKLHGGGPGSQGLSLHLLGTHLALGSPMAFTYDMRLPGLQASLLLPSAPWEG